MVKLVNMNINRRMFKVAEIKKDYIGNIIESAKLCPKIKQIYLFGSCLEERCKEKSDIDIAVFGDLSQSRMFKLRSYDKFCTSIYEYFYTQKDWELLEYLQDYDILYFKIGEKITNKFLEEAIFNGICIYMRSEVSD